MRIAADADNTGGANQAYKTIARAAQAEIVEKKSRFIAQIAPAENEDAALAFIDAVRRTHAQARHNVYAYALRGGRVRYTDDGEPSGTAGMPILQAIQHAELENVALVVTRYFGGVLLGTGGLARAYTGAAQAAIQAAHVVNMSICVDVSLCVPYAQYEQACRIAQATGAHIQQTDFAENVRLTLRALNGSQQQLIEKLTELTRARSPISTTAPFTAAF